MQLDNISAKLKAGFAVVPGLWIVIWYTQTPKPISVELGTIILLVISLSIGGVFCAKECKLSPWGMPALGALFWLGAIWLPEAWHRFGRRGWGWFVESFYRGFYDLFNTDPFWFFQILAALCIVLILIWIFLRSRLRLHSLEYFGISLFGLVTICYSASLYTFASKVWPLFFLQIVVNFTGLSLIVILGLKLARYDSLKAMLLVTVCEPLCSLMILRPLPFYVYPSEYFANAHLTISSSAILMLPIVSFIVVIPLMLLISHTTQKQTCWLILLSALTFGAMHALNIFMSQGIAIETPFNSWVLNSLLILQIWMPMLIIAGSLSPKKI